MTTHLRRWAVGKLLPAFAALAMFATANAALVSKNILRQPLFEENKGQDAADVRFRARLERYDAKVLRDGSVRLSDRVHAGKTIRIKPAKARAGLEIAGIDASSFHSNYFSGPDRSRDVTDVPHFERVRVSGVYDGIDLVYYIRDSRLEFDFDLKPGADSHQIRMDVDGATPALTPDGHLDLAVDGTSWTQYRPVAYQDRQGRIEVPCAYRIVDGQSIALELATYDRALPLTVDPIVDYSSYYGGSGSDEVDGLRVGPDGSIYIAGTTNSPNLPAVNALDSTENGAWDAFVAKLNPVTGKLVYATYLGGNNGDTAAGIALDGGGNVYVTGHAEARFPTTTGAYQTSTSTQAGFVSKISAAGNTLVYSTLIAGTTPHAIEVDALGRAAVTGEAGVDFTPSAGAFQTAFMGPSGSVTGDAFAVLLNATGTGVVFATYYGGSQREAAHGVAFDASGQVVIGGDGFITAFAPDGKSIAYSSTIAGSIKGLVTDPYGNLIAAGSTSSASLTTVNAIKPFGSLAFNSNSVGKGFVAKFATAPTFHIVFSTYAGNDAVCCDDMYGVGTDSMGDIYILGNVRSDALGWFHAVNAFMSTSTVSANLASINASDAFYVAGYARDGSRLLYQTLFGACGVGACSGTITGGSAGYAVAGGNTLENWHPISAYNTKPTLSGTTWTDGYITTFGLERASLLLETDVTTTPANSAVTLKATSYAAKTGTAAFYDGATLLGSAPLVEGIASLQTTFTVGVKRLKAAIGTVESPVVLFPVTLP